MAANQEAQCPLYPANAYTQVVFGSLYDKITCALGCASHIGERRKEGSPKIGLYWDTCTEWPPNDLDMFLQPFFSSNGPILRPQSDEHRAAFSIETFAKVFFANFPIFSTRLLRNVCKLFRYWTQPSFLGVNLRLILNYRLFLRQCANDIIVTLPTLHKKS